MSQQLRRLFVVILVIFAFLDLAVTNSYFFRVPSLNADGCNERAILHATKTNRGPIVVNGVAIASSSKTENSQRFQCSCASGPLYAPTTGYLSPAFSQVTEFETAAESVLDRRAQALLAQRLRSLFSGVNRQGGGPVLTIDPMIQEAGAAGLKERKGAVVALDAETGAVLALYSSPFYDLNALAAFDTTVVKEAHRAFLEDANDPLVDRAVDGNRYTSGSVFEILTSVALLENGIANPDTPLDSPVPTLLPNTETSVSNVESQIYGNGQPALSETFARSCNASFVIASQSLTHEQLADVAIRFGLGSAKSIPPSVTPSVFPERTDAAQPAISSIGQFSVQVAPMQMARVT